MSTAGPTTPHVERQSRIYWYVSPVLTDNFTSNHTRSISSIRPALPKLWSIGLLHLGIMLSATSGVMRIGARRAAPRAAAFAVTPMPKAPVSRTANLVHARAISTTGPLANALNTNPNPPLGKKNASNDSPSRIGLIGARGYTGQALIDLLNNHPNMDLRHVSSRELKGQELKGYDKRKIIYESLSPEDVARLDKDGQVDCWGRLAPPLDV